MERESYTRSEIYELLWTEPATKVALRIGHSDVALGKWCKQYDVQSRHWVTGPSWSMER